MFLRFNCLRLSVYLFHCLHFMYVLNVWCFGVMSLLALLTECCCVLIEVSKFSKSSDFFKINTLNEKRMKVFLFRGTKSWKIEKHKEGTTQKVAIDCGIGHVVAGKCR